MASFGSMLARNGETTPAPHDEAKPGLFEAFSGPASGGVIVEHLLLV
ncbi:MAG TPA: hypothetical protein VJ045_09880 [Hyphomicrobiaceae bacterium]|nr:hypothetical protein [Hyphomicrobiaceae bacterium]